MQIIHLGTIVQSVFAFVDDEGNVVRQEPVKIALPKIDKQNFIRAADELLKEWQKLRDNND